MNNITIISRKEIDEAYKNLLNKMLEDNQFFGRFQDVDWLNKRVVKGTIRIELEISDLEDII